MGKDRGLGWDAVSDKDGATQYECPDIGCIRFGDSRTLLPRPYGG